MSRLWEAIQALAVFGASIDNLSNAVKAIGHFSMHQDKSELVDDLLAEVREIMRENGLDIAQVNEGRVHAWLVEGVDIFEDVF